MSHLLSALQIFLGKYELGFFLSCISAFIKEGLQHSHRKHKGDVELPTAHFHTQLPARGRRRWQGMLAVGSASSSLCGKGPVTSLRRSGSLHSHRHLTLEMLPETFEVIRSRFCSCWSGHFGSFLSDVCDMLVVSQHGATSHQFF